MQVGSDIVREAAGDRLGYSATLSNDGNRVAIGARGNNGNGSGAGHVRIYDWDGTSWTQAGSDIDGEAAGTIWPTRSEMATTAPAVAPCVDFCGVPLSRVPRKGQIWRMREHECKIGEGRCPIGEACHL